MFENIIIVKILKVLLKIKKKVSKLMGYEIKKFFLLFKYYNKLFFSIYYTINHNIFI